MTDAQRLRTANAILSEVLASPSVPNGLRRLAAEFVQTSQDIAKIRRSYWVDKQRHALAEEAAKRLAEQGQRPAHPDVIAHWKAIAAGATP